MKEQKQVRRKWLFHLTEEAAIFCDDEIENQLNNGWLLAEDYFALKVPEEVKIEPEDVDKPTLNTSINRKKKK